MPPWAADYEDVSARLRSDRLIQKFLLKYLDDPSFDQLCAAMAAKDREEAFRAAHTIKGVCQNLSFTRLLDSSSRPVRRPAPRLDAGGRASGGAGKGGPSGRDRGDPGLSGGTVRAASCRTRSNTF